MQILKASFPEILREDVLNRITLVDLRTLPVLEISAGEDLTHPCAAHRAFSVCSLVMQHVHCSLLGNLLVGMRMHA